MRLRFIILVLLALLITAGFVGAVSAENIGSITVYGISAPSLGDNLVSSATTNNKNVTASVFWSPNDDVFSAGKTYEARVNLSIIGDYENFTDSTKVTIDNISKSDTSFEDRKKITITFSSYIISKTISDPIEIILKKPVEGETASNPTTKTKGIKEVTISWLPELSSNKFEPNKTYTANIAITSLSGYEFSDPKPDVKIGEITLAASKVTRDLSNKLTATYVFDKTGMLSITTLNLSLTPPIAGESASIPTSNTEGIDEATVVKWTPSLSSNKFEENKTYTATINVTANPGYLFGNSPSIKVNNDESNVQSSNYKVENNVLTVNYTFPITTTNNISSVTISNLDSPIYGESPDTTVTSTAGTTATVTWSPTLLSGSKFEADTTYVATIVINTESSAYIFSASPVVKLGTTTLTSGVTRNSDSKITVNYTFPKTTELTLPTIIFNANQKTGAIPLDVVFTYNITNSTSQNITYGDGTSTITLSKTNDTLEHTYSTAGTYTAKITAKNANGTTYKEIKITPKNGVLNAYFTYSPSTGNAPLTVSFTDKSEGTISSWHWNFGGYKTSSEKNPSYTFTVPGAHIVTLTIKDSSGAEDIHSETIVVQAAKSVSQDNLKQVSNEETKTVETNTTSFVPNPIGIIQELVKLFMALFNFDNYIMFQNNTTVTSP